MAKISKSSLAKGKEKPFEGETLFEGREFRYPLRGMKECHYFVKATVLDNRPHLHIETSGVMEVEDTLTGERFLKPFEIEEECDIMEEEDDEGSGYILPGNNIDLEEVVLLVIESSLPLRVRKEG